MDLFTAFPFACVCAHALPSILNYTFPRRHKQATGHNRGLPSLSPKGSVHKKNWKKRWERNPRVRLSWSQQTAAFL